ncbi:hypothetical protein JTE88_07820 [Arcanobacterium phocisimile]|uniref:Uncharacterized protein n=1 Tax=Arcanobacterium phocisimile TaxID=1302235 RepID=A0ABX7IHE5_9ACTO|nr:hypothetical protein [Arcanobacterium phocisimile]QRV01974.1 hypothetical protein JTE88_07820 [Arcanobacterium phocisimile]
MSRLMKYFSAGVLLAIVNSFIVVSPDLRAGVSVANALSNNAMMVILQAIVALVIMGVGGVMREKVDSGDFPDKTVQKLVSFALLTALVLISILLVLLWR